MSWRELENGLIVPAEPKVVLPSRRYEKPRIVRFYDRDRDRDRDGQTYATSGADDGAAAVAKPEGLTGDMDPTNGTVNLDDPDSWILNIEDAASWAGNWLAHAHTATNKLTLETGGPNGLNYVGFDTNSDSYLKMEFLSDFVDQNAGCIGCVFRSNESGSDLFVIDGFPYLYAIYDISTGKIDVQFQDQDFSNMPADHEHDYTANTWRALVLRWDGSKFYSKMNGESNWTETTVNGGIAARNVSFKWGDGLRDFDIARGLLKNDGSSDMGDSMLNYLVDQGDL